MAKNVGDMMNRIFANPKGTGAGLGLLAAVGFGAWGAANSFYTGRQIFWILSFNL